MSVTDDRAPDDLPKETGLPAASPNAPHVTGRAQKKTSLVQRMQKSKERARTLAQRQHRRIPIQVAIPIEVHETIVELAEKNGARFSDVVRRCIVDGLTRYAKLSLTNPFEADAFGVLDRYPKIGAARTEYGKDENGFRAELSDEVRKKRAAEAQELGLRGFRNA